MEQQAISSDLIRGHIDTIILHTLIDGDKFAQQISDAIELKSDKEYKINQATLYSSLKRLESLRYVKSYWNDSDNGRRKYFKLTENGKNTVELNLSSWSYSRAIIDKLMDCEQQPIIRTQYVEKIVEKPVEIERPIIQQPTIVSPAPAPVQIVENVEKPQQTSQSAQTNTELGDSAQDINFRNILNGLIRTTVIQKPNVQPEQISRIVRQEVPETQPVEVQKFNETITSFDYNAERNNNGKIDFGDLTLKAAKEGYKIRISSKDSCITKGNLLLNKLNAITSFLTYVLSLIAIIFISFGIAKNSTWGNTTTIILALVFAVLPIFYLFTYIKSPKETSSKRPTTDEILTSVIIVFNLVLITVAANLIFSVNFADINLIALTLILPIVLCVIFCLHFVIRYNFSKLKCFKINIK